MRRGRLIEISTDKRLLPEFLAAAWQQGRIPEGSAEVAKCRDDYQSFITGAPPDGEPEDDENQLTVAIEAHLRDFLAKNVALLEPGLHLYSTESKSGVEFPVDGGRIDLLCVDSNGGFVVVDLKLSVGRNRALGQLLYYMGWVDQNLGKPPMSFAIQPVSQDPLGPLAALA